MSGNKRASASVARAAVKALRAELGWTPSDLISILRGGGSSSKGSGYERELCGELSLWWTHGARDDIFWRSSGSGARAKVRGRRGADTHGQHGDISATDPIGQPLIDMFTIEIKRGYSEHTIQDILDRLVTGGRQTYEDFLQQTIESSEQAGSYAWLMITRRDRRRAMVWFPMHVFATLRSVGAFPGGRPRPYFGMRATVRNNSNNGHDVDVCGMALEDFLGAVGPHHIITMQEFA